MGKYSASKISEYNKCPRSYKYTYIDNIKIDIKFDFLEFGTLFHQSIKKLETDDGLIISMIDSLNRTDFKDKRIIEYEKYIETKIDGKRFNMFLDAITKSEVLEFKTTKNRWNDRDLKNNFIQSTIYQKATKKVISYYVVSKLDSKVQQFKYFHNNKDWMSILKIIKLIESDVQFKVKKTYLCNYCRYQSICQKDY